MAQTYYELLGVAETATSEEIEAAFRSRASDVHPDRLASQSGYLKSVAAEAFKNLSEAKTFLLDPAKRLRYDEELARSRGRSAPRAAAAAASAPASYTATDRTPARAKWAPSQTLAFAILAVSVLLLAGLLWNKLSPRVPQFAPAAVTPGSAPPPVQQTVPQRDPAATKKTAGTSSRPTTARPRGSASNDADSHALTLWRASEPPDLSGLSSADRLSVESSCSYAKMQSPDEYNGCLAHQLAIHGTAPPPPDLSAFPVAQRQAIESACASVKLVRDPATYNQCIVQQLELTKRRAP